MHSLIPFHISEGQLRATHFLFYTPAAQPRANLFINIIIYFFGGYKNSTAAVSSVHIRNSFVYM